MKNFTYFSGLILLSLSFAACAVEGEGDAAGGTDGQGDADSGESPGDPLAPNPDGGDGDGDGDSTPGDGDGDNTPGDGDGDNTPGDGDGDGDSTPGDGDGDSSPEDPTEVDITPIDGGGTSGRYCAYEGEQLSEGTTVFSPDGCTRCVCWEDGIECSENYECSQGTVPASCEGLTHRESRSTIVGDCVVIELCKDGTIESDESCGTANSGGTCFEGNVRFLEGERMSDNADGGACYCGGDGKAVCLF